MRSRASAVVSLAVVLVLTAAPGRALQAGTARWNPPPATSWQRQLTGTLDLSVNAVMLMRFNGMRKNLSLNAFREACPAPRPVPPSNVRIV